MQQLAELCSETMTALSCSTADSTGTHSLYTTYKDYELMFHVSTMLPYTPNNRQQVSKLIYFPTELLWMKSWYLTVVISLFVALFYDISIPGSCQSSPGAHFATLMTYQWRAPALLW